ncbi:MAG: hypothetical protein QOF43_134 [Gaiellaceae bacterium]|nr:hypothetical protein [Gaiellaceae bacterium]
MTAASDLKAAENELLLENVVKHVGQLGRSRPGAAVAVICECGDEGCRAALAVPFREYSRARSSHPRRFVVAAGHERSASDVEVESRDGYRLVEEGPAPAGET